MARPRLVALANIKNEAWIVERWLQRTSEIADTIIALDGGSTDGTAEILERHPAVHQVIRLTRRDRDYLVLNLNRLLDAVAPLQPEWVLMVDADEIMDARLPQMLGDLLSRPGVGRYLFREITLWRSNQQYRIDKPELHLRIHPSYPFLVRYNRNLRWESRVSWKGYLSMVMKQRRWPPRFPFDFRRLEGIDGETVELGDVVKLHYHFADWDHAWRVQMRWAILQAINHRSKTNEIHDLVAWATYRMDETGLQLASVKPEWGPL